MSRLSKTVAAIAKAAALAAVLAPTALYALTPDLSPEQKDRPRAEKVPEAIAAISKDFKFANDGVLTVATTPFELPLDAYAADAKTPIGNELDIAQLIADSLGVKLQVVPVAWPDWPLGLVSG
jgi:polar amino acid transport system substrate-binding protein